MEEKKDIKESLELLAGLEVLAVALKKASKDGFDKSDILPFAKELVDGREALLEAVKGISEVKAEGQDLDLTEAQELGLRVWALVAKVQAA